MRAWQGRSHRWLTLVSASFDPHASCNSLQCLGRFQTTFGFSEALSLFVSTARLLSLPCYLLASSGVMQLCTDQHNCHIQVRNHRLHNRSWVHLQKKFLCNFEETGGCEIPALVVYEGSRGEFSVSNSSRSAPIGRSLPCVPITNFPSQLLPSHNIWGKSRYLGRVHNFQFRLLTSIYVHYLCEVFDSIYTSCCAGISSEEKLNVIVP